MKSFEMENITRLYSNTRYIGCAIYSNNNKRLRNNEFINCSFRSEVKIGEVLNCYFEKCSFYCLHLRIIKETKFEKCVFQKLDLDFSSQRLSIHETEKYFDVFRSATYLNLQGNQLSEIPETIGNLTNIKYLHLENNQITEIPETIGNLTNLTQLYLYNNRITEIPKTIGNLTNLTELSLNRNQIKKIPKIIGNLINLAYLSLYNNQITKIPKVIGNLTNLTNLNFGGNQITEIPETIKNLTNLKYLQLGGNNFDIGILKNTYWQPLQEIIKRNKYNQHEKPIS